MPIPFNFTARLNVTGPYGINGIVSTIRKSISGITAPVKLSIDRTTNSQLKDIGKNLAYVDSQLRSITSSGASAARALNNVATAMNRAGGGNATKTISNANDVLAKTARGAADASKEMQEFGRVSGLAIRRFAGFTIATGAIFGLVEAVKSATHEAIAFQKSMVTLSQVTGNTLQGVAAIEQEVTRLSTSLGVSSNELIDVAKTLAQAGLTANQTKKALDAIAKSSLAPSFDSMAETVEGAIAAMRQFNLESTQLESVLGSINSVAAQFAVEAEDIVSAIRRTGGVYAAAANPKDKREAEQSLREFISLFTSVRATTRESAESIATGLRTIFSRLQRRETIESLKAFNVELERGGKFVGPFEAVRSLNQELSKLDPQDIRFSKILEELGGFRQIGKVIPLILQFGTAVDALKVAESGQASLAEDAATAQLSLANRMTKTREEFLALIREMANTDTFKSMAKTVFFLSDSLISLARTLKPILPALAAFGAIKAIGATSNFVKGFRQGVSGVGGAGGLGEIIGSGGTSASAVASRAASTSGTALATNTSALAQLTNAVNALNVTMGGRAASKGGRKGFASGGLVRLSSGSGSPLKSPKGFKEFSAILGKDKVEAILGKYNISMFGKKPSVPIRADSSGPGKLAYEDMRSQAEALSAPSNITQQTDKRKRPIPTIGNRDGSPMVAGFYLRGSVNDGDGPTSSSKVIGKLREANVIPSYIKAVKMPIAHYLPNKEVSTGASNAIQTSIEGGIAKVVQAMGGNPDVGLIQKATSNNGIDLSDAAGKMFEAGLSVGTGIVAQGVTTNRGKSRPMDFPELGQVQKLMKFFGDGITTARYGDAKLTAGQDASKKIRGQFADFISQDPSLVKEMRSIVKGQLAPYEQQRASLRTKKASGGMVDVALTPGELVFGPSATASIGETALRNFNNTGVLSRNTGGDVYQVPGTGNSDSFYTQLPEGSFVIKKSSAQGYASGGRVRLAAGGILTDKEKAELAAANARKKSALSKAEKAELLAKKARTGAFGEEARVVASANTFGVPRFKRAMRSDNKEVFGPPRPTEISPDEMAASARRRDLSNRRSAPRNLAELDAKLSSYKTVESEQAKVMKALRNRGASEEQIAKANKAYEVVLAKTKGNTNKAALAAEKVYNNYVKMGAISPTKFGGDNPFGSRLKGFGTKIQNFANSPSALIATIAGTTLIDQVSKAALGSTPLGQAKAAGLTGAFGGAMTGASLGSGFGPVGAVVGGVGGAVAGGASAFIETKNQAEFALANQKLSDSADKLDAAFQKLSADISDINLKGFDSSLGEALTSADELSTAFRKEEGNSLTSFITGAFNSRSDDLARIRSAGAESGFTSLAMTGLNGLIIGGGAGVAGTDANNAILEDVNNAATLRKNKELKEIVAARSGGADLAFKNVGSNVKSRAISSIRLGRFDKDAFVNSSVNALSVNTLRGLATKNNGFKEAFTREGGINDLNAQAFIEQERGNTEKSNALKKSAIDIEIELGKAVAKSAIERQAVEAQLEESFHASTKAITLMAESVKRLGDASQLVTENLDTNLSSFENLAGGTANSRKVANPFTNFEVRSSAEINAAIGGIQNLIPGSKTLNNAGLQVQEGKLIADNISNVLKEVLARTEIGGINDNVETVLREVLSSSELAGLSETGKNAITNHFAQLATNRQDQTAEGGPSGGLTPETIRNILIQSTETFADNTDNLTKTTISTYAQLFDTISSGNQRIGDAFGAIVNTIQQRNAKLDQAFALGQERSLEISRLRGKDVGPNQIRANVDATVKRLTNRAGLGGTVDSAAIATGINALENQIQKDNEARLKIQGSDINMYNMLSANIANNTSKLADARQALDTLATSTDELSAIQTKLAELEQRKNAGRNLLEKVAAARFDPRAAVDLNKEIQDAFKLAVGRGAGVDGGAGLMEQIAAIMGPRAEARIQASIDRARLGTLGPNPKLKGLLGDVGVGTVKGESRAETVLIARFEAASSRQIEAMNAQAGLLAQTVNNLNVSLTNVLNRFIAEVAGLRGRKSGGWIGGHFKGNRDTELTRLVPGEFVVRRDVAQAFGPQLEALNAGVPVEAAFARGGAVLNAVRNRGIGRLDLDDRKELRNRQRNIRAFSSKRGALAIQDLLAYQAAVDAGDPNAIDKLGKAINRLPNTPDTRDLKKAVRQGRILRKTPIAKAGGLGAFMRRKEDMDSIKTRIFGAAGRIGVPGFADGGIVAATMPGEFVVDKGIAAKNQGFLSSLNRGGIPRFANGGSVGGGSSSLIGAEQFTAAVQALVPAFGNFAQFATQLAQAANNLQKVNIPSRITMEIAPIQLNVVVNGVEAFNTMESSFKTLVVNEINKTLRKHINTITGETNESYMRG